MNTDREPEETSHTPDDPITGDAPAEHEEESAQQSKWEEEERKMEK